MRVLVAMSGGVDSSVAAALVRDAGHEVVGATMKLWGGRSDSGCCSLADVTDARRVADALGIEHRVFNLSEEFTESVVEPYAADHASGRTPNPCVECNRHLKFGAFLARARRLGFEAIATGHHARLDGQLSGEVKLRRAADAAKDQSYVLSVLSGEALRQVLLPIGELTKAEVRARARDLGLRTADKPDSQEVCFIARHGTDAGRSAFLGERIALHPGRVIDAGSGTELGTVPAIELVTVGQRRGLGAPAGDRQYALDVDVAARTVRVGPRAALDVADVALSRRTWVNHPLGIGVEVEVQTSAHGSAIPARLTPDGVSLGRPARRVAPGQVVALYRDDVVVGSGIAC